MEFSNTEVKRAIRDFKLRIEHLNIANHRIYDTRVKEFIDIIEDNQVLRDIIGPYFEIEIDFVAIEGAQINDWFDFKLPSNTDIQIAYVLQVMILSSRGQFSMKDYTLRIFRHQRYDENIIDWNNQILTPVLDKLSLKLEDLIEDEVEGREHIPEATLQIINHGTITAQQGNIAMGHGNTQTIEQGDISNSIVDKALEEEVITEDQLPQLKTISDDIENELKKESPSEAFLKESINRLYDLGEKALLKVTDQVINHPAWKTALTAFLL